MLDIRIIEHVVIGVVNQQTYTMVVIKMSMAWPIKVFTLTNNTCRNKQIYNIYTE